MKVKEGKSLIEVPEERLTKKATAFYNPDAAIQRNLCVAFFSALDKINMRGADLLAGTGVRSARLFKELPEKTFSHIDINDGNPNSVEYIKKNVTDERAGIHNENANLLLEKQKAYDYIEIDPFGSPNPFLDAAVRKLRRGGILAITATDTAALCGRAVKACLRKYWARPLYSEFKHEVGMRILIRKAQLIGAQYDIALKPVYCHSTQHYMRVYFVHTGHDVKPVLEKHLYMHYCFRCLDRLISRENQGKECCGAEISVAGPLWIGELWDEKLAEKIAEKAEEMDRKTWKIASQIANESRIKSVGHYSIPKLSSVFKVEPPKTKELLEKIGDAAVSHFSKTSFRTSKGLKEIRENMINQTKTL